jgi:hypothetical protein
MNIEISDNEKRNILQSRISSFTLDLYGHELNRQIAVINDDQEEILKADQSMAIISNTIEVYKQEFDLIPETIENQVVEF